MQQTPLIAGQYRTTPIFGWMPSHADVCGQLCSSSQPLAAPVWWVPPRLAYDRFLAWLILLVTARCSVKTAVHNAATTATVHKVPSSETPTRAAVSMDLPILPMWGALPIIVKYTYTAFVRARNARLQPRRARWFGMVSSIGCQVFKLLPGYARCANTS